MKKIFSILGIAILASCTPEEQKENCNCETVVKVQKLNLYSNFITYRNDCTGEIRNDILVNDNSRTGEKLCK